ncbi:MAG TPA: hypothetical protein VLN49_05295 [Gemmatimonadaceae bacterium]|nr:hypothetical protein [Gemmatimonadaceae bacterium]
MRRPRTLTIAGLLAMSACTYGPAQHRVQIQQVRGRPETRTFAAVVWSEVRREATGLAAFPDGGSPKIRDQAVTIYVADADQLSVRRVGQIRIPREMDVYPQPYLDGWQGSSFYLTVSGCPRPGTECDGKRRRKVAYRVDEDGTMTRVDAVPPRLEREPGMGARAPGERVYMRIYERLDTVFVRTVDEGPFVPLFILNRNRELAPIRKTP